MRLIEFDANPDSSDDATGARQVAAALGGGGREAADRATLRLIGQNLTATAIEAGDWVAWDLATAGFIPCKSVKIAPATDDLPATFGVALEAIPAVSGSTVSWGAIAYKGYVGSANVTAALAIGTGLQAGNGAAGRAEAAGADSERLLGVTVSTVTANRAAVWIF